MDFKPDTFPAKCTERSRPFRTICFFLTGIILLSFFSLSFSASSQKSLGRLEKRGKLLVVHLQGAPYQLGYQHGRLLKKEIKQSIDYLLYRGMVSHFKKNIIQHSAALKTLQEHSRLLERCIPSEYVLEMKGIAAGAGVSYQDILLLHTFIDSLNLSFDDWKKFYPQLFFSCSNFMVWGKATEDSFLYHGRNLDLPEYGKNSLPIVVFFCQPDSGLPYVSVGWAGICGVFTGMNSEGISFGENVVNQKDLAVRGLPLLFVFRRILQYSHNLGEALAALKNSARTTGGVIALSDGKTNRGMMIEFTAHHWKLNYPQEDFLISTNHFLNPELTKYEVDELVKENSISRWQKLKGMIGSNYGQINLLIIRNFLNDSFVQEKSETLYPLTYTCGMKTLQSVIFLPAQRKLWVAQNALPAQFADYLVFELDKEFKLPALPQLDLNQGEKFFHYRDQDLPYQLELLKTEKKFLVYQLSFPAPVKSPYPENNLVRADYYLPRQEGGGFPAVIVLPILGAKDSRLESVFCRSLVNQGIAALLINLPYNLRRTPKGIKSGLLFLTANVEKSQLNFRQAVIEAKQALDWLEKRPEILPEKIGIMGISLGAEVAAVVLGVEKRLKSGCFILAGGDLAGITFDGSQTRPLLKRISPRFTKEELRRKWWKIDPLTYAYSNINKEILLINGWFDRALTFNSMMKLWLALGEPRVIWLAGGHYSSLLYLFWIRGVVSDFFYRSFNEQIKQN
ncbi:MAG: C45 family autoproteolytic acyltransferase/hydrolase [Elusimicrobiota bacterium]